MQPLPHRYTVALAERQLTAPPRTPIAAGAPVEFGGSDTVWSPEELLVAAVLECVWTTFEAYARHDKLVVRGWSGSGTGVLDRGPKGPVFTSIALDVELDIDAAVEPRARELLAKAERDCIISRAVNVPITLHATVRGQAAA